MGGDSDTEGREAVAIVMSSSRCEERRSNAKVECSPWMDAVAVPRQ